MNEKVVVDKLCSRLVKIEDEVDAICEQLVEKKLISAATALQRASIAITAARVEIRLATLKERGKR